MQLASIPGIFRTILIIVLVYYIFKYAVRLFTAAKVKSSARRSEGWASAGPKKEGDVTIEYIHESKRKRHTRPDDADQVDFEEIED